MCHFLKEYLSAPDTIGAIAPSSRHLAASMTASIDFGKAHCIVEYGAGTGVFTQDVVTRKRRDTTYIVFMRCFGNSFRECREWCWFMEMPEMYAAS